MLQSLSCGFRETAVLVEVFRQLIANGDDVFLIRQRGREIAAAIGFDDADQVRIATALSEVGRDALAGGTSTAVFEIDPESNRFVICVDGFPKSLASDSPGIVSAKRLMFSVAIDPDGDGAVENRLVPQAPGCHHHRRRDPGTRSHRETGRRNTTRRASSTKPAADRQHRSRSSGKGIARPAQRRTRGNQQGRDGDVHPAVRRVGLDQPRGRRPLQRTRRQVPSNRGCQ